MNLASGGNFTFITYIRSSTTLRPETQDSNLRGQCVLLRLQLPNVPCAPPLPFSPHVFWLFWPFREHAHARDNSYSPAPARKTHGPVVGVRGRIARQVVGREGPLPGCPLTSHSRGEIRESRLVVCVADFQNGSANRGAASHDTAQHVVGAAAGSPLCTHGLDQPLLLGLLPLRFRRNAFAAVPYEPRHSIGNTWHVDLARRCERRVGLV